MTSDQSEKLLVTAKAVADILIQKGCTNGAWTIKQETIDWLGTQLFDATHTRGDDGKWVPLQA